MEIDIQAKNFKLTDDLSDYVKLHLGFDDSQQYHMVSHVFVQLTELDDVKNGPDKNCFITVMLEGMPANIEVQNTEKDMHYAIDLATKRARKTALLWTKRYGAKIA